MPPTDLAAATLFREATSHIERANFTVVDYLRPEDDHATKLGKILGAYQIVFPDLPKEQIVLCGAADWIRDNLTAWLYDSHGKPIAFRAVDQVFSTVGDYVGLLGRYDKNEDNNEEVHRVGYRGEIVGNRLLFCEARVDDRQGGSPESPFKPRPPQLPANLAAIDMPGGFRDVTPQDWATTKVVRSATVRP